MVVYLLFHVLPIVCGGSVFGLCFVSVLSSFAIILTRRERSMICFNYFPDVLGLLVFCGSYLRCRGLVCRV